MSKNWHESLKYIFIQNTQEEFWYKDRKRICFHFLIAISIANFPSRRTHFDKHIVYIGIFNVISWSTK